MSFRKITYSSMLYESTRDYFSINKNGQLSIMYKILLAVLWPLQIAWNNFELFRAKTWLISQTKWQIGQITNLLNYLYDSLLNRISIDQSTSNQVYDPTINYAATSWDSVISDPLSVSYGPVYEPCINDNAQLSGVIIHIPITLNNNSDNFYDLVSTIEKIRPLGIFYTILSP